MSSKRNADVPPALRARGPRSDPSALIEAQCDKAQIALALALITASDVSVAPVVVSTPLIPCLRTICAGTSVIDE